jgi:hypothetical protein
MLEVPVAGGVVADVSRGGRPGIAERGPLPGVGAAVVAGGTPGPDGTPGVWARLLSADAKAATTASAAADVRVVVMAAWLP